MVTTPRLMWARLDRRRPAGLATLVLAALGFVSLGVPEGMLGVAWPAMRASFDLPLDALGALLATFASGYCLASVLSGRVLERFGIGPTLAVCCALTGLSLLGYAAAPAWTTLVAIGGLLGAGAGMIDAALNVFAATRHGPRALNWMHAAFGFGAAAGPALMGLILAAGLSWTVGYVLVGLAQLVLAVGYGLTRDRFGRGRPAGERRASGLVRPSMARLLRRASLWLSLGIFFLYAGFEVSAGQWSFSLFTIGRGLSPEVAGVLISAYWASLTLGRLLFGALVPRLEPARLLRWCMLGVVGTAGLIWLNVPLVSGVALAVTGLLLAPIFPLMIAATPGRLGPDQAANAVGLEVAAAVVGGAGIAAAVGVLAARIDLEVIGPCLVVVGLAQVVLYEVLERSAALARHDEVRDAEAA